MSLLSRVEGVLADYHKAARRYGTSVPSLLWRAYRLWRWRGFRFREALREGLLDPSLPDEARAACMSKKRMIALQKLVNTPERECLTEDKAVFYPYCKGLGLPVPEMYAVLGRGGGYTSSGRPLTGREEWVAFLAEDLPEECVVKPAFGFYGLGVRFLQRKDGRFEVQDGRSLTPSALYDEIVADRTFRKYLFQERLVPHPEIRRLSGSAAVQTVRMVTELDGTRAECNHAVLRIAVGANLVDNYHQGQTGNLVARVDLATGRLAEGLGAPADGIGLTTLTVHPGTGVTLTGFPLPSWAEALSLAESAAVLFYPMRSIGWDVALTRSGPVLIEANIWWDSMNLFAVHPGKPGPLPQALLLERLEASARRGRVDAKS